jgi:hypothetical protein
MSTEEIALYLRDKDFRRNEAIFRIMPTLRGRKVFLVISGTEMELSQATKHTHK